jgi:hypothetical protein
VFSAYDFDRFGFIQIKIGELEIRTKTKLMVVSARGKIPVIVDEYLSNSIEFDFFLYLNRDLAGAPSKC